VKQAVALRADSHMDACWENLFFTFVQSEKWMCDSSTRNRNS